MRFTPDYQKIKPLFKLWDPYRLGPKSIYAGPQEIDDNTYQSISTLCKKYGIENHLKNILWFAVLTGKPKLEDQIQVAIERQSQWAAYAALIKSFTNARNNISTGSQISEIIITDNLKNKVRIQAEEKKEIEDSMTLDKIRHEHSLQIKRKIGIKNSGLLDKIYEVLLKEAEALELAGERTEKNKGRKPTNAWRDDHSYYLYLFLNKHCGIISLNDRYRFIFYFMKLLGFHFESLNPDTDTDKKKAERVSEAIERVTEKLN